MSYMVPNQTRTCFKKIFQTYRKTFLGQVVGLFLHSSFHWTNMCFNKISSGDNLGCICYLLLKPRYKKLFYLLYLVLFILTFSRDKIFWRRTYVLCYSLALWLILYERNPIHSFLPGRKLDHIFCPH